MSSAISDKPQILIVDDSRVIRLAAKKMLGNEYHVHLAEDGEKGWEYIQQHSDISVVFSDLSMPNMDGMALLESVRSADDDYLRELPVVILTGAEDDEEVKQQAMDAGATDFILKPFDSIDLISRAKAYARMSQKVVELEENSVYDKLTGLYNARALHDQGIKAVSFAIRHHLPLSLCILEIRDVQACFLKYGKKAAQAILLTVVKRIQAIMREEDIAARLDLSQFALLLPVASEEKTLAMIRRIQQAIQKLVFDLGAEQIHLVVDAGCTTLASNESVTFEQLLDQGKQALSGIQCTEDSQLAYYSHDNVAHNVVKAVSTELTEIEMEQVIRRIMLGEFEQIPPRHLDIVAEQFAGLLHYLDDYRPQHAENL